MAAIAWERVAERQPPRPGLRVVQGGAVYRRRRALAVLVVVALAFVAFQVMRVVTAAASAGAVPTAPVVLVAQPGDSYWTLANRIHAGGDLRSTVDALVAANGGGDLHPGDRITLAG